MSRSHIQSAEFKRFEQLAEDKQNTHLPSINQSVGYGLVQLEEKFWGNGLDEKTLNAEIKACFYEIRQHEITHTFIDKVIEISQKKEEWDDFDVYLSVSDEQGNLHYRDVPKTFRVDKALTLVWRALNCTESYVDKYTIDKDKFKSEEAQQQEKLRLATNDLEARKLAFFNVLNIISQTKMCNSHNRNEMVALLNHSFENFSIIDPELAVRDTIREVIMENLIPAYQANTVEARHELNKYLHTWIETNSQTEMNRATELYQLLDPEMKIIDRIVTMFKEHGINPAKYSIKEIINDFLANLGFFPDPTKFAFLSHANNIINDSNIEEKNEFSEAVINMQKWLKQQDLIALQLTKNADFENFTLMYTLYNDWDKDDFIVRLSNIMPGGLDQLEIAKLNYFRNCNPPHFPEISAETKQQIETFKAAAAKANKELFKDEIVNFFALLVSGLKDASLYKALLRMIMNSNICNKILLTDEEIENLYLKKENNILELNPYYLNRILLHAMIVNPKKWSITFEVAFEKVVKHFLNTNFNSNLVGLTGAFKKTSYPQILIDQFNYMLTLAPHYQPQAEAEPPKPKYVMIHPSHVTNGGWWVMLVRSFGLEIFADYYRENSATISKLLFLGFLHNTISYEDILKFVPQDYHGSFHRAASAEWASGLLHTISVLPALNETERVAADMHFFKMVSTVLFPGKQLDEKPLEIISKFVIENFLTLWSAQPEAYLFQLLLHPAIEKKIKLSTVELASIQDEQIHENNNFVRILLHGFYDTHAIWDKSFITLFEKAAQLCDLSTHEDIKQQINYLIQKQKNPQDNTLQKPNRMIIMPDRVETISEWQTAKRSLDNKLLNFYLETYANIQQLEYDSYHQQIVDYPDSENYTLTSALHVKTLRDLINNVPQDKLGKLIRMLDEFNAIILLSDPDFQARLDSTVLSENDKKQMAVLYLKYVKETSTPAERIHWWEEAAKIYPCVNYYITIGDYYAQQFQQYRDAENLEKATKNFLLAYKYSFKDYLALAITKQKLEILFNHNSTLKAEIPKMLKAAEQDIILNDLIYWFDPAVHVNSYIHANLFYELIFSEKNKSLVTYSENELSNLLSSDKLSRGQVNRVCLNALILLPKDWSDSLAKLVVKSCDLLNEPLTNLKKQLKYLHDCYVHSKEKETKGFGDSPFPLLLLPDQANHLNEWISIIQNCSANNKLLIYSTYTHKINICLCAELDKGLAALPLMFNAIPLTEWKLAVDEFNEIQINKFINEILNHKNINNFNLLSIYNILKDEAIRNKIDKKYYVRIATYLNHHFNSLNYDKKYDKSLFETICLYKFDILLAMNYLSDSLSSKEDKIDLTASIKWLPKIIEELAKNTEGKTIHNKLATERLLMKIPLLIQQTIAPTISSLAFEFYCEKYSRGVNSYEGHIHNLYIAYRYNKINKPTLSKQALLFISSIASQLENDLFMFMNTDSCFHLALEMLTDDTINSLIKNKKELNAKLLSHFHARNSLTYIPKKSQESLIRFNLTIYMLKFADEFNEEDVAVAWNDFRLLFSLHGKPEHYDFYVQTYLNYAAQTLFENISDTSTTDFKKIAEQKEFPQAAEKAAVIFQFKQATINKKSIASSLTPQLLKQFLNLFAEDQEKVNFIHAILHSHAFLNSIKFDSLNYLFSELGKYQDLKFTNKFYSQNCALTVEQITTLLQQIKPQQQTTVYTSLNSWSNFPEYLMKMNDSTSFKKFYSTEKLPYYKFNLIALMNVAYNHNSLEIFENILKGYVFDVIKQNPLSSLAQSEAFGELLLGLGKSANSNINDDNLINAVPMLLRDKLIELITMLEREFTSNKREYTQQYKSSLENLFKKLAFRYMQDTETSSLRSLFENFGFRYTQSTQTTTPSTQFFKTNKTAFLNQLCYFTDHVFNLNMLYLSNGKACIPLVNNGEITFDIRDILSQKRISAFELHPLISIAKQKLYFQVLADDKIISANDNKLWVVDVNNKSDQLIPFNTLTAADTIIKDTLPLVNQTFVAFTFSQTASIYTTFQGKNRNGIETLEVFDLSAHKSLRKLELKPGSYSLVSLFAKDKNLFAIYHNKYKTLSIYDNTLKLISSGFFETYNDVFFIDANHYLKANSHQQTLDVYKIENHELVTSCQSDFDDLKQLDFGCIAIIKEEKISVCDVTKLNEPLITFELEVPKPTQLLVGLCNHWLQQNLPTLNSAPVESKQFNNANNSLKQGI